MRQITKSAFELDSPPQGGGVLQTDASSAVSVGDWRVDQLAAVIAIYSKGSPFDVHWR